MVEAAEQIAEPAGLPVEFSPDGQDFTLSVPIEKIDHEKRLVTGIATSEREDAQLDCVSFDASKIAFSAWPGNVREQHAPRAVGRRVSQEFDEANRLVKVTAHISRGAQDTWLKLTEDPPTLTAFSIGGKALETSREVIKADDGTDRHRRRVNKYALSELSLVDNPANPDCQLTLVKADGAGGLVQTDIIEEEPTRVVMNKGSEVLVVDPQAEADILEYLAQSGFEKIGQLAKVDVEGDDEPPLLQAWLIKISCPSCGKAAWTPKLDSGGGQIVCGECNAVYEVGYGKVDESLWKTAEEQLSSGAGKSTLEEVKGVTSDLNVVYDCPSCDYTSKPTTVKVGKQAPEKKCPECDTLLVVKDVGAAGNEGQETATIAGSPEELQTQLRGAEGEDDDLLKGDDEPDKPKGLVIRRLTLVAEREVDGRMLKMYKQGGLLGRGRWITMQGGKRVFVGAPKGRTQEGQPTFAGAPRAFGDEPSTRVIGGGDLPDESNLGIFASQEEKEREIADLRERLSSGVGPESWRTELEDILAFAERGLGPRGERTLEEFAETEKLWQQLFSERLATLPPLPETFEQMAKQEEGRWITTGEGRRIRITPSKQREQMAETQRARSEQADTEATRATKMDVLRAVNLLEGEGFEIGYPEGWEETGESPAEQYAGLKEEIPPEPEM